jgi:hypothetical protein
MTDHTISPHFIVNASAGIADRSARIEARAIELLAEAMAGPKPSFRDVIRAQQIAPLVYRGISALPSVIKAAIKEVDGG